MITNETIVNDLPIRVATELLGAKTHPEEPIPTKRPYHMSKKGKEVKKNRADLLKPYQWKKGQSGNPAGRPPNPVSLTAILNRKLAEHPEDAEAIVNALIALGKRPSLTQLGAIDKIFDRVDGKVAETHRIEGEFPVRIMFVPAERLTGGKKEEIIEGEARELLPEETTK